MPKKLDGSLVRSNAPLRHIDSLTTRYSTRRKTVSPQACREGQDPQGLEGTESGISLELKSEFEQARNEPVALVAGLDCFTVSIRDRSWF